MAIQFVDDLTTYLQTQGHGTKGTDLFKGSAPAANVSMLVVTDTGGLPNQLNEKGAGLELATVQILARDKHQEVARDKLQAVQDDLHQLQNTDLGTFTVVVAKAVDRPSVIGIDTKERWGVTSNYECLIRPS